MFCHLENRALLKVSGSDSESFLQAQLSNDIEQLDDSSIQLTAYCQHQGKILALFWVMRSDDSFLLSFPIDLLEVIKARLEIFDYIEVYYNRQRKHSTNGYFSPVNYEKKWLKAA